MLAYLRKSFLPSSKPSQKRSARPLLESLEERLLLYSTYGGTWTYGSRITYSFMPDGTSFGSTPSVLFQTMNAKFPTTTPGTVVPVWETAIEKAAAVWEAVANINLAQVPETLMPGSTVGFPEGCSGNQQDDPRFGDIRIGAIDLGTSVLGETSLPPPSDGGTAAGDIFLNSDPVATWQIDPPPSATSSPSTEPNYDLETVAIHEFGHALGLDESQITNACMYASYNGTKQSIPVPVYNSQGVLSPCYDDISGIQSILGAPQPDQLNSNGQSNGSYTTPANITSYQYFSASNLVQVQTGSYLNLLGNNFVSGQEVTFHADPNGSVGGLTDGNTYYVVVDGSNPAYIGLASSYADATASNPTLIQLSNISGTKNYLTAIDSNGQIAIPSLRITSGSQAEWFSVTVPSSDTSGTFVATVQSTNLSSLSPKVAIFTQALSSSGATVLSLLGSASSSDFGATVSVRLSGVRPGQTYLVRASGNSAGSPTGGFGLELNFGSVYQPPIAPPNTLVASQPDQGGGVGNLEIGNVTAWDNILPGNLPNIGYGVIEVPPNPVQLSVQTSVDQSSATDGLAALVAPTNIAQPQLIGSGISLTATGSQNPSTLYSGSTLSTLQAVDYLITNWNDQAGLLASTRWNVTNGSLPGN